MASTGGGWAGPSYVDFSPQSLPPKLDDHDAGREHAAAPDLGMVAEESALLGSDGQPLPAELVEGTCHPVEQPIAPNDVRHFTQRAAECAHCPAVCHAQRTAPCAGLCLEASIHFWQYVGYQRWSRVATWVHAASPAAGCSPYSKVATTAAPSPQKGTSTAQLGHVKGHRAQVGASPQAETVHSIETPSQRQSGRAKQSRADNGHIGSACLDRGEQPADEAPLLHQQQQRQDTNCYTAAAAPESPPCMQQPTHLNNNAQLSVYDPQRDSTPGRGTGYAYDAQRNKQVRSFSALRLVSRQMRPSAAVILASQCV